MEFKKISIEEFRKYAAKSPYRSFMQTPEIATIREESGWKSDYLSVKNEHGKILAATMILSKPTFLKKYQIFYAPGGPLLDLQNSGLTDFFFGNLQKYAYYHNGYVIHIDPYYELIERDRHGCPVDGGFNHEKALQNLQNLGCRPLTQTSMPKYLYVLDLEGRSADDLFKNFKQNTRNLTRRSERLGVKVRELTREELPILKKITASTAERRGFTDQPLSYYEKMYDIFAPRKEVQFLVAEADIEGEVTPLSVAMFILVGDEVIYLYSGSDERYMKTYNAQYAIQWHMIKYAADHGFRRYNFYGIRSLPTPDSKPDGVYSFKKGFGGHVVELIGSFELPVRPRLYRLHHLLSTAKGKVAA